MSETPVHIYAPEIRIDAPILPTVNVRVELAQTPEDLERDALLNAVREQSDRLTDLRRARESLLRAGGGSVSLSVDAWGVRRAPFEAPTDLALLWIDRGIGSAKTDLRKALIALRDFAVKEMDAL